MNIKKLIKCQSDFAETDRFFRALKADEVREGFIEGKWRIVQQKDGDTYCVLTAMDGWIECFAGIAEACNFKAYDDKPFKQLVSKLRLEQPVSIELVKSAKDVVDVQRKLYMASPNYIIEMVAQRLLEENAQAN